MGDEPTKRFNHHAQLQAYFRPLEATISVSRATFSGLAFNSWYALSFRGVPSCDQLVILGVWDSRPSKIQVQRRVFWEKKTANAANPVSVWAGWVWFFMLLVSFCKVSTKRNTCLLLLKRWVCNFRQPMVFVSPLCRLANCWERCWEKCWEKWIDFQPP